jgi:hypothetical protein
MAVFIGRGFEFKVMRVMVPGHNGGRLGCDSGLARSKCEYTTLLWNECCDHDCVAR